MGFRFRKSWKIAPGIRLNLGKKSASISFGGKGARYTVSSTGRKTATVGIPGTGISYSKTTGAATRERGGTTMGENATQKKTRMGKPFYQKWWVWGLVVILLAVGVSCGSGETVEPDLSAEDEQIEQLVPDGEAVDEPAVTTPTQSEQEEPEQEEANDTKTDSKKQDTTVSSGGAPTETPTSAVTPETPKQEQPKADPTPEEPVEEEPETTPQPQPEPEKEPETPAVTQPETSAPSTPSASQSQAVYIGSVESDKYHKSTCRWAKKILEENRIYFSSKAEAAGAGYSPCGTCKP